MEEDQATNLKDLERRLARLELQNRRLREFLVPAFWNALDRLEARTADQTPVTCLACGRAGPPSDYGVRVDQCMFGGGRLERLECPVCGCVFGPMKYLNTPAEIVSADYSLLYSFYSEGDSTEEELRAFESLHPKPGGLYLNWGSGAWSRSVEILRDRGYDVWGYEPNAMTDSPFVVKRREEVSARFDGIFCNNVIEHLFSPREQFLEFRDLLKPAGAMCHASPCYEWSYAFTRFHVFFPLGRAPEKLAERSGFKLSHVVDDGAFHARVFSL